MNREEFIQLMNHPELLDKSSVDEMRELVDEFPYFQSGHLLFLKNLHLLDNIRFPSQLKVSAAHITDREVLYHLLHEKRPETTPVEKESEPKTVTPDTHQEPSREEPMILIDEDQEIIHQELEEIDPKRETKVAEEGSISSPTISSSMVNDLLNFEYSVDSEEPSPPDEKEPADEEEKQVKGEQESQGKPVVSNITITERFSFAAWLDLVQEKTIHDEMETPAVSSARDKTKDELIDKFLSSDPKIISSEEPDEEQEDISVPSVTEDDGLISDTLARIYVKQGYYSKAIFAYEKLSLKFPEKSSYFASQIEKIQQLINKL